MKFKYIIVFICILTFASSNAAVVDTVQVYSISMHKNIKSVIIKPDNYAISNQIPVVYLLHGYGGNYSDWITKIKGLEQFSDQYSMLIVCPDGGYNSWYIDSPVDTSSKYETFVSNELIAWVDNNYKTIKNRNGRAITGLSMGGHGALYLAFKHQDIYGAAGSMSGGVDIRPFPNNWDMSRVLGTLATHQEYWEKNTVVNLVNLLTPNSIALMIDCGAGDFFYKVNQHLHEQLMYYNIPHDYIVRPGDHSWPYWKNAIKYQLLFMNNFFKNKLSQN